MVASKMMKVLLLITAVAGGLPFAVYAWARATGSLPSEEVFRRSGGNHSPWWTEWQGNLIGLPLALLVVVALVTSIVLSIFERKAWPLVGGMLLIVFQVVLIFVQLNFLFWTID